MGRRALIIALASFLVIAVGAAVTWAIIASGTPTAAPTTAAPEPTDVPVVTPAPTPTEDPLPTPSATPTTDPADPPPAPITALAAKPAPHTVRLDWTSPADQDVLRLLVVRAAGKTTPGAVGDGDVVGKLAPGTTTFTDKDAALTPGKTYSYSVFVQDIAKGLSPATGLVATLPVALSVTPVDIDGSITQEAADGPLTDSGSLAFTAFNPKGPRIAVVKPAAGVLGALTRSVTEPVGSAPGVVAWTYTVQNADLRSLADGAKKDDVFVVELRDGADRVPTTVTVTLHGINDAPVVAAPMPGQAAIAGQPFVFPIPAGTFSDPDATDTLALTAGSLPGWLSFTNGQLLGTPGAGDTGSVTVTITATDPAGQSVSADVTIDIATPLPTPNQPPVAGNDAVTFDLGVDPLQTSANVLGNDNDPDGGPNALAAVPADADWMVNGQVAGHYTLDSSGALHLDSGVAADGPLQSLGAGEQVTGTISYAITDGTDTVPGSITVTAVGGSKAGNVTKVFVPESAQAEPARELGHHIH